MQNLNKLLKMFWNDRMIYFNLRSIWKAVKPYVYKTYGTPPGKKIPEVIYI